jgi:hypothetical protein
MTFPTAIITAIGFPVFVLGGGNCIPAGKILAQWNPVMLGREKPAVGNMNFPIAIKLWFQIQIKKLLHKTG